jgi:sulfur carrier protein
MNVFINGQSTEIAENISLSDLLAILKMSDKPVVLEMNQQAIFPGDYHTVKITENSSIEIVTLAAGG